MIRLILVVLAVVLYLIFSIPVLFYLKDQTKNDPKAAAKKSLDLVRWILGIVRDLAGITYEVRGLEHIPSDRAVLYVGNHRSYFDILAGYTTVPTLLGFVAKKEMERIPLLRTWMVNVNCLFLDRKNIKEGLKTILQGIEKVKNGVSIWIFPEGTRNPNEDITELLPFKEGSLKIAEKSGCPVVPVAMTGTAEVLEKHFPFITPSHITIYYGKPFYVKELEAEDRKHPGAYTRNVLIRMLKEMQEEKQ